MLREQFTPRLVFAHRSDFVIEDSAVYLFGMTEEDRSHLPPAWKELSQCVEWVEVLEAGDDLLEARVRTGGSEIAVHLRSNESIGLLFERWEGRRIFIDVTGIGHHVWAPLLRVALDSGLDLSVVYSEPRFYMFSDVPRQGAVFNLSARSREVESLPGFGSILPRDGEVYRLVALLGFEGSRFARLIETVQPGKNMVHPVVGVPGFRAEYPYYAYEGNRLVLDDGDLWQSVSYASADCPFAAFRLIEDLLATWPEARLQVAMLGTKPHSVGAVLAAVLLGDRVELLHDNPVRSSGRTEGDARVHVYSLSEFAQDRYSS